MPRNRSRQPEDELHGALLIDKPAGPTSHDIVDIIRGNTAFKRSAIAAPSTPPPPAS